MLVAWEVMLPSWTVNDPRKFGAEPSFDFLVADERMQFTVVEAKCGLNGTKPAWQVLCQISYCANEAARLFSMENVDRIYTACWSGGHDWAVASARKRGSFTEHHREFFGLRSLVPSAQPHVDRGVAACQFSEDWSKILAEFNGLSALPLTARLKEELTSQQSKRGLNRFLTMTPFSGNFKPIFSHRLVG